VSLRQRLPLLVAVVGAAAFLVPAAWGAGGGTSFTVEPTAGSALSPRGDYFSIESRPRRTVTQYLAIRNDARRPLGIRLAAVDAKTAQLGGVAYALASEKRRRVGGWMRLATRSLTLGPRETRRVSFTLTVPAGASSGEHLGGIAVWSPVSPTPARSRRAGKARPTIVVHTRRVIAVLVRVPGPAAPLLAISGVEPAARADGAYLLIRIANRGSAMTKATGSVVLPDEGFRRRLVLDTIVPATSIAYPVRWRRRPSDGEHDVTVDLRYGGRRATWEGSFRVGESIDAALVDRGAVTRRETPTAGGTAQLVIAALAGGGLALALAAAGWLLVRRRAVSGRRGAERTTA
jgi:hypothetical protein